ncbi:MAG: hypothetical protein HXY18_01375 [Bryobacteraceae bacterium]|jgi:hypothetical protein|nr:hypothetical protein [Bryobacteraceae bacterium]
MMEKLANLLFRCWHRRLSRPMGVVKRRGAPEDPLNPEAEGYVVCLDCGKKFSYDPKTMSIGGPIEGPNPLR